MDLVLGTVQLGMSYGATNRVGQPQLREAQAIVETFANAGGKWLDTAPAYGDSERVLGVCNTGQFRVSTKTEYLDPDKPLAEQLPRLQASFHRSLRMLNRDSVDILLIHQPQLLNHPEFEVLLACLRCEREAGRVGALGVSIYQQEDLQDWPRHLQWLDWVQLPLNILDQRALGNGLLRRLRDHGVRIQARSIFLQGVLLTPKIANVEFNAEDRRDIIRLHQFLQDSPVDPLYAALDFVRQQDVDMALVGVNQLRELEQILIAWQQPSLELDYLPFASDQLSLLTPQLWQRVQA